MIIVSDIISNLQEPTDGWQVRAYVPENFHDADGNLVLASRQDLGGAYFFADFVTGNVPEIEIPATTDSPDNRTARYWILGIYDQYSRLKYTLLADFIVSANLGETATITQLIIANAQGYLGYTQRDGFFTGEQVLALFNDQFTENLAPDATTVIKGKGVVSVAPVDPARPIFVGDNDPRLLPQDVDGGEPDTEFDNEIDGGNP